jgi:hypothetical protein
MGKSTMPSKEALIRSARIPLDEERYMDTLIIKNNILTTDAKKNLRIIKSDNKVFATTKPEVIISIKNKKINIDTEIYIDVEITNTIKNDKFNDINLKINEIPFNLFINNNKGVKKIQINDRGKYEVSLDDERFLGNNLAFEVK